MTTERWLAACLCLMPLTPTSARAQRDAIDPGSLQIGGSVAVTGRHQDGEESSDFSIDVAPTVGVFVVRGLMVSAGFSFGHASSGATTWNDWGVGPGISYYFASIGSRAHVFAAVQASFGWTSGHSAGRVEWRSSGHSLQVRPSAGLDFMVVPHVGLRGELYVSRSWYSAESTNDFVSEVNLTRFGFSAGVAAFVF